MNILCLNISVKALSIDFMFFNPKMILRYLLSKSSQIEKKTLETISSLTVSLSQVLISSMFLQNLKICTFAMKIKTFPI